ncbi:MAG: CocE/NonD family hydrolase [Acidimicrobiales bacterium]
MRIAVAVLAALVVAVAPVRAAEPDPFASGLRYVTVSDGTSIAVNVQYPAGYQPGDRLPTIIQIDGYDGATGPDNPARYGDRYVAVAMSLRGTGCSGGSFNLFDRRSSQDGYEVIEWIARQSWSNGDVAIWGHSYSGITGWLVASTRPPSLRAMSVSGLIDDLYRGIVYMGGVANLGFPALWTGVVRPAIDVGTGTAPQVVAGDLQCTLNAATRPAPDLLQNPVIQGGSLEDSPWFAERALTTYLDAIDVPIHIVQAYQDEQTGPRGSQLLYQRLDELKPDLPKRLVLTNGVHSTHTTRVIQLDRVRFLDNFLVAPNGIVDEPRVRVWLETHQGEDPTRPGTTTLVPNGMIDDPSWPLASTDWTRLWFGAGGSLSPDPAVATGAPDPFIAGTKRTGTFVFFTPTLLGELTTAAGPDHVDYVTAPFAEPVAVVGPINVELHLSSLGVDTEVYVELSDRYPDGREVRLQRGMLKASHREVDESRSDYTADGELYRAHRPHTNTLLNLLTPGQPTQLDIEVFALGHVFRPGHQLVVRVTSPPAVDSLAAYVPTTVPTLNQVHHAGAAQSSILLPVVPVPDGLGPEVPCGLQVGLERCVQPAG